MPDPELTSAASALASPAEPSSPWVSRIPCPACAADLTFLPASARFCHHCGNPLPRDGPAHRPVFFRAEPPPAPRPRFTRPRWLFNLWCACTGPDVEADAFAGRSRVLLAYGKALFNLGWRYETAVGSRRNLEEAARCYWKAARLGDAGARHRLDPSPDPASPNSLYVADLPPLATVYSPPPPLPDCC